MTDHAITFYGLIVSGYSGLVATAALLLGQGREFRELFGRLFLIGLAIIALIGLLNLTKLRAWAEAPVDAKPPPTKVVVPPKPPHRIPHRKRSHRHHRKHHHHSVTKLANRQELLTELRERVAS